MRRYPLDGGITPPAHVNSALEARAVLAATDTLRDSQLPEREMLEDTRRVWGPFDVSGRGKSRLTQRLQ